MIVTATKTDIEALAAFERGQQRIAHPIDCSSALQHYWFHAVMGATTLFHKPQENAPIDGFAVCRNSYLGGSTRIDIQRLFVSEAERNGGVGTALMKTVINTAAEKGLPTFLYVWRRTPGAVRFYERLGYTAHSSNEKTIQMRRDCLPI
jgi:GNAT superfamily N-acetyltransferase